MAEFSVFDKLVTGLSSSERQDMLERIASSVTIAVSASVDADEEIAPDLESLYRQMGFLRRVIIAVISIFTGRDRLGVVESQLLGELRRRTAASSSDYDSVRDLLRPSALESFRKLSASARHFATLLSRVMGRERSAFIAFLAGLHVPEVQHRLLKDADPFEVAQKFPDLGDSEIRRRSMLAMEECLVTLPAEIRTRIYHDVRALHHLMALASFSFEKLIAEFGGNEGDAIPVPLSRVATELGKLAGILQGLTPGPSPVFLEALSLYQEQDRLEGPDEQIEGLLERNVAAGNNAYSAVVEFAARYPVTNLVRLAHGNIHWKAVSLAGGEDWFAVWKGFWQDRVEKMYRRFSFRRRTEAVLKEARESLGLTEIRDFPGYPPSGFDYPAKHGLSSGLVRAILGDVYQREVHVPLTALFREGEFYKSDNRNEFDEAMREIERLRTETANLEVRLQPTGDLGMLWKQSTDGTLAGDAAEERQEALSTQIDTDASAIVRRMITTFRSVANILEGVLYGTVGGRYDTVSNLGQIGAPDAQQLKRKLEFAHVRSKAIADVLSEVINLESLQQPKSG